MADINSGFRDVAGGLEKLLARRKPTKAKKGRPKKAKKAAGRGAGGKGSKGSGGE